jgi:hypothetical protein
MGSPTTGASLFFVVGEEWVNHLHLCTVDDLRQISQGREAKTSKLSVDFKFQYVFVMPAMQFLPQYKISLSDAPTKSQQRSTLHLGRHDPSRPSGKVLFTCFLVHATLVIQHALH